MCKNTTVVQLGKNEQTYRWYVSRGFKVTDLILWFRAELAEHQNAMEKYSHHHDDVLANHSRHVEQLARELRAARQLKEALLVA